MQIWVKQYIICIEERACASAAYKHLISAARLANVCTTFAKYHRQRKHQRNTNNFQNKYIVHERQKTNYVNAANKVKQTCNKKKSQRHHIFKQIESISARKKRLLTLTTIYAFASSRLGTSLLLFSLTHTLASMRSNAHPNAPVTLTPLASMPTPMPTLLRTLIPAFARTHSAAIRVFLLAHVHTRWCSLFMCNSISLSRRLSSIPCA
jgi:hypothetical protein